MKTLSGEKPSLVRLLQAGDTFSHEVLFRVAVATQALKLMMEDWQQHYVVYPLTLQDELQVFRKRSYFFLIGLDAPLKFRYTNYCKKHGKPTGQLQGFLKLDDQVSFT